MSSLKRRVVRDQTPFLGTLLFTCIRLIINLFDSYHSLPPSLPHSLQENYALTFISHDFLSIIQIISLFNYVPVSHLRKA